MKQKANNEPLVLCGAKSRRTGQPCRQPAMKNGRCRLHGGKSTGPRTKEGLSNSKRASWKHGFYSAEAKLERSVVKMILSKSRAFLDEITS